ncbi:FUSC family protein [Sulfurimonas sp. MAG313]|nr:FUSC family protein [Sulfurimonas sp. MAG313]MDF1881369.1 FUSC family protein [Sulfurimonas sp. MAG313]
MSEDVQSKGIFEVSDKFKFAVKTSLSMVLAFIIPFYLGWTQASTAATTVMLIAATGSVRDSIYKGILRLLGTIIGAVIGLSLIALFPQDRLLYLFSMSLVISLIVYLYYAYQG